VYDPAGDDRNGIEAFTVQVEVLEHQEPVALQEQPQQGLRDPVELLVHY
jgi:hypothetical protein